MFEPKKHLIKNLVKFKVVHSVPGRVRLRSKASADILDEFSFYDDYLQRAIKLLNGVEEISTNYIIGTMLINYNVDKVYEAKILKWIDKIIYIGIENLDLMAKYSENNSDYVIKTLEQQLKEAVIKI